MRRLLATGVMLLMAPWAAQAQDHGHEDHGPRESSVLLTRTSADPGHLSVLEGEEVVWRNASSRTHTVTAADGQFDARLSPARTFRHRFASSGTYAYSCRIHPTITGMVAVRRIVLDDAPRVAVRGERVSLAGRVAPGVRAVGIEADHGSGFVAVGDAVVDESGAFHASVVVDRSAGYRAVAGGDASDPVTVEVVDARSLSITGRLARDRAILAVRAVPAAPGARVVLQARLRERFGWWTVRRKRLDERSRARFTYPRRRSVSVRAVLVGSDRATALARSESFRIRSRARE